MSYSDSTKYADVRRKNAEVSKSKWPYSNLLTNMESSYRGLQSCKVSSHEA